MTYRDNVSSRFAECVAQIWWKWVGDNGSLLAFEVKTRMAQPVNIHPAKYNTGSSNNQGRNYRPNLISHLDNRWAEMLNYYQLALSDLEC